MMTLIAAAFRDNKPSYTSSDIACELALPDILLGPVKQRLIIAGLIEIGSHQQLLPTRDPGKISVLEVIEAMRCANETDSYEQGKWPSAVEHLFGELAEEQRNSLASRTLYDLLH